MLARVLAEPEASYPQAADLLGKIGDATRARRAAPRSSRAPRRKRRRARRPTPRSSRRSAPSAARRRSSTSRTRARRRTRTTPRSPCARCRSAAIRPCCRSRSRSPPTPRPTRSCATRCSASSRRSAASRRSGAAGDHLVRQGRDRALPRLRVGALAAKAEAIGPALEAFPAGAAYKKVDVDDLLVKLIEKLGRRRGRRSSRRSARRAARAHDGGHVARAGRARRRRAGPVEKLAGDSTSVKGFPAGETIGKEAARVAEALKKKS